MEMIGWLGIIPGALWALYMLWLAFSSLVPDRGLWWTVMLAYFIAAALVLLVWFVRLSWALVS